MRLTALLKNSFVVCFQIDRIMEIFAERYTTQNPEVFPTADSAFILAFSVIMLNTDLHNPAIKEERRMTKAGFLRNNRGICDGQDLPEELLSDIFDRIKSNPISLKEDDEAREKVGNFGPNGARQAATGLFATANFDEMDKARMTNYKKERDEILRSTESLLRRKSTRTNSGFNKGSKHFVRTKDSGLKDEYVSPMFEVAWGPALAVFSTVIESANGTMGSLLSIATDHEIERAAENAAESTEVCLEGFKLAIRLAGVCGNSTARSAYVHALSNFSLLGTGRLLEHRHIRCVQTLLELGRDDGETLGPSWEYVFKALSEVARLNQVYEEGAKFVRAGQNVGLHKKRVAVESAATSQTLKGQLLENVEASVDGGETGSYDEIDEVLINGIYDGQFGFDEELDKIVIDEINARTVHDNLAEDLLDEIFSRSSSLSTSSIKEFIFQLCRVSRMEISGYGGSIGNKANDIDLTAVHYRRHHSLVGSNGRVDGKRNQPDIFCLQKLIEVTHYNMDTRPRLVFADIWSTVSGHLTSTALHNNAAVAIYAVDSFRQLSMQFLKRQELGVFEFQRKFIKPFESVMVNCKNSGVKEFLLKAVEQIITIYGDDSTIETDSLDGNQGLLRSGWRPLLFVIGQASCDDDDAIAKLGFSMLTSQLRLSLHINDENKEGSNGTVAPIFRAVLPMRSDKFVDLVEALLMYVSGPRDDMSADSIDQLIVMCRYLADDKIPLPRNCRATHIHPSRVDKLDSTTKKSSCPHLNEELELWWPIMLGLSKTIGDKRPNIRMKGLIALLSVINEHFFVDQSDYPSTSSVLGDLQTLQLIFRGILTPSLEHTDLMPDSKADGLTLPDGFIRFSTPTESNITKNGPSGRTDITHTVSGNDWLETTFDHLMDGTVAIVLRSIDVYKNDILIEEILAMFNTCLVSDSISMAIRGLKRLYHFIANDLRPEKITNGTWATFCHMLRKCLVVNGLPFINDLERSTQINSDVIVEFLQEEKILPQRHYVSGNAVSIIGSLLTTDPDIAKSMGPQWYLFLISGLGMGIRTWDKAAQILNIHPVEIVWSNPATQP
jgi:SEC7 domain proteins